jgi:hypothetical protein
LGRIGHHPSARPGRDNAALAEPTVRPEPYLKLLFNPSELLYTVLGAVELEDYRTKKDTNSLQDLALQLFLQE